MTAVGVQMRLSHAGGYIHWIRIGTLLSCHGRPVFTRAD